MKAIDPGAAFLQAVRGERPAPNYQLFAEGVARSFRLYQRGLITANEFVNVTGEDLRRLEVASVD
ncbi:hypothetical protein [Mycobacterium phage WXIN]|nr:hypothetical protein [Mycobacterium phage WXIN]